MEHNEYLEQKQANLQNETGVSAKTVELEN